MKYRYVGKCIAHDDMEERCNYWGGEGWRIIFVERDSFAETWHVLFEKDITNDKEHENNS